MPRYDHLDVHFLNVGHGNCTIIHHPRSKKRKEGRVSVIDIHDKTKYDEEEAETAVEGVDQLLAKQNVGLSFGKQMTEEEYERKYINDPVAYYRNTFSDLKKKIWRFISTHPDMDHIAGIKRFHEKIGFDVFWATDHNKEMDTGDGWHEEYDREDWYHYQNLKDGETSTNTLSPNRGNLKDYWEQDNIQILHPTEDFVSTIDNQSTGYNDTSYVLKIDHGNQSFLLPGDVEEKAWNEIIDYWGEDVLSDVTVLQASHHGRRSGFHREAVEMMDPNVVIVSVGNKTEHDGYGLYYDACSDDTDIYSTRQYGRIRAISTGRRTSIQLAEPEGIFNLP